MKEKKLFQEQFVGRNVELDKQKLIWVAEEGSSNGRFALVASIFLENRKDLLP